MKILSSNAKNENKTMTTRFLQTKHIYKKASELLEQIVVTRKLFLDYYSNFI